MPVKSHRGVWNVFHRGHQMRGRFKDGIGPSRRPVGRAKTIAAARARMLSDRNPMRNPATHRKALAKTLRLRVSKTEIKFGAWAKARGLPLKHTGGALMWIGRRNPDFRVIGKKKCVEVTQKECFAGGRKPRTLEGYALPTIRHYEGKGWKCLVVYVKDHRCALPTRLAETLTRFAASDWSGVWLYDRLIQCGA